MISISGEATSGAPEAIIVDVGHGNCTIVRSSGYCLLVDVPDDSAVYFTIQHLGIRRFDYVVISHRDNDHVAGLPTVLANEELEFGRIFVPADATKDAESPRTKQLLAALGDAKRGDRAGVSRDLDDAYGQGLSGGGLDIEVLAPTFEDAMTGPGGRGVDGTAITSNRASAILRVRLPDGATILLPGDADEVALGKLRDRNEDLEADVLIFPHHGTNSSVSDERAFANDLCQLVKPRVVLFSVGRGTRPRPSPEIVAGVRQACPESYIACTQLCIECASEPLSADRTDDHLTDLPASGRRLRRCCAGTIRISLEDGDLEAPVRGDHQAFIDNQAPAAMCRRAAPQEAFEGM
jgi:beta-lactamase superfamily II metal-dependent hydrolase